eukprot:UN28147
MHIDDPVFCFHSGVFFSSNVNICLSNQRFDSTFFHLLSFLWFNFLFFYHSPLHLPLIHAHILEILGPKFEGLVIGSQSLMYQQNVRTTYDQLQLVGAE